MLTVYSAKPAGLKQEVIAIPGGPLPGRPQLGPASQRLKNSRDGSWLELENGSPVFSLGATPSLDHPPCDFIPLLAHLTHFRCVLGTPHHHHQFQLLSHLLSLPLKVLPGEVPWGGRGGASRRGIPERPAGERWACGWARAPCSPLHFFGNVHDLPLVFLPRSAAGRAINHGACGAHRAAVPGRGTIVSSPARPLPSCSFSSSQPGAREPGRNCLPLPAAPPGLPV